MNAIVSIRQLSKAYGKERGISDIELDLFPGDIYGLLGPNGAGKTTLLKLVTGLIRADKGTVSLFGSNISDQYELAMKRVGCMIESADFHDFLSADQYLRSVARFYPEINEKRIDEMLKIVGLQHVRTYKIKHYSTGMKQKLALAAAVMAKPEFVILDEPTNGLDIEGTVMFRNLVTKCSQELGTTFIISSHMIHELEQLCNRVGILFDGKLRTEGRVSDLLAHKQSLEQFYIHQLESAKEAKGLA
ncbi:ABC transporter ATP-binding protein [Paenibacillus sp. UNC451MF]|uniref:ABC transporter ATP-binding protein n=1 Tax=Paenibacillus sp. UNC451MF TaxID=1449063 RepID=UPI00048BF300|nr:ABC transporter ATP-binding protein [Paenibacillus sp. UNC451MF]